VRPVMSERILASAAPGVGRKPAAPHAFGARRELVSGL
jgi:hypothetical protein